MIVNIGLCQNIKEVITFHISFEDRCHAIAITVGRDTSPICDTLMKAAKKGELPYMNTGVGACRVENCQFNEDLECVANSICATEI